MLYELRVALIVILTGSGVIYGVFLMPALTSGGTSSGSGLNQAEFEATVSRERAYCQQQPEAIDCACFAQRSSLIQSHNAPKVTTAFYADQRDLARGQAADDC